MMTYRVNEVERLPKRVVEQTSAFSRTVARLCPAVVREGYWGLACNPTGNRFIVIKKRKIPFAIGIADQSDRMVLEIRLQMKFPML